MSNPAIFDPYVTLVITGANALWPAIPQYSNFSLHLPKVADFNKLNSWRDSDERYWNRVAQTIDHSSLNAIICLKEHGKLIGAIALHSDHLRLIVCAISLAPYLPAQQHPLALGALMGCAEGLALVAHKFKSITAKKVPTAFWPAFSFMGYLGDVNSSSDYQSFHRKVL